MRCSRLARRLWAAAALALTLMLVPGLAAAFGARGHAAAGAVADALLTPRARAQVQALLGMPLRSAATWADCVKDVKPQPSAEGGFAYQPDPRYHAGCAAFESPEGIAAMVDYVRRNWRGCNDRDAAAGGCHALYHYTDVAIRHDAYDRAYAGTSDHDVVSAVGAAIAVLQGRPAPAPFDIRDTAEALRLLAHLVGDLHQPLHVGAIYLDAAGRSVDPDASRRRRDPAIDTRGGNRLEDGETNLHAEWDEVTASLNPARIPRSMLQAARQVPTPTGAIDSWPAQWAGQTLQVSRQAFRGLAFSRADAARPGDWTVRFDDRAAYMKARDDIQSEQLTRAGARLAQVLNAIWP